MAWNHYRNEGRRWPLYWFGINCAFYCVPLLVLTFALLDKERWFVGLSICLTLLIVIHARRTSDENISTVWKVMLALTMIMAWAYTMMLAYWPDGDTEICYDRIRQTAFRGPLINMGPDPNCTGIPLRELD